VAKQASGTANTQAKTSSRIDCMPQPVNVFTERSFKNKLEEEQAAARFAHQGWL